MARVGFKKIYAAGTFTASTLAELFGLIRTTVIDAGFKVLLDDATTLDFSRADAMPGVANDDMPHWAFTLTEGGAFTTIAAHSVYGAQLLTEGALSHNLTLASAPSQPSPTPEVTLWVAADGGEGWWWCHVNVAESNSPTGWMFGFGCAGVTSRRYASDLHQGLCARYGLRTLQGDWYPVYARNESGAIVTGPWTASWSPLGMGWANNSIRHDGSALSRMAAPQFPARDGGITACVLGEYNEVLALTNGYALEERVLPGWMALVGGANDHPYALPAPDVFSTP